MKYLFEHNFPDVTVYDSSTSGMDVMFKARSSDALIIVDANMSNSEAGSLFIVPGEELANIPEPSFNLHVFRWDNAIYAGIQIYKEEFPEDINVYLIEAESVDMGIGMSDSVIETADKVIEKIKERINDYVR